MSKEKFYINSENKEQSVFRHELMEEFRNALRESNYELDKNIDGLVVLSAPPALEFKDSIEQREKTPENISRIDFAFDLWKHIAAKKLGKEIEDLHEADFHDPILPPFILNGETEQLQPMKEIAVALGVPEEKISLLDCGRRGVGNTKTQFTEIANDPKLSKAQYLAFISSSYHVPRVSRTADINLPKDMNFEIVGVPFDQFSYDIFRKIRGETKRILSYSEKGDIAKYSRKN